MGKTTKTKKQIIIVAIILVIGLIGFGLLGAKKPPKSGRKLTVPPPVVEVTRVETSPTTLKISGEGNVEPLKVARLIPQVSGRVVFVSASLVEGGRFEKGDLLVEIEPRDYELAIDSARAALKNAESALAQAEESSRQAAFEWELAHGKDGPKPPPLAVRQPQLDAAVAARDAAKAELERAVLNLERTKIRAPFSGFVHEKSVDLGQYVSPGQSMATLYGTDAVEVRVPMELERAVELVVPGFNAPPEAKGSKAVVRSLEYNGLWSGRVVRSAAQVDRQTRMIDIFVRVEDPYLSKPPLAVGLFVGVELQGAELGNGCFIPVSALHGDGGVFSVWTVDKESRIRIRQVEMASRDGEHALIRSGLETGDLVITTPLAEVRDGMEVLIAK